MATLTPNVGYTHDLYEIATTDYALGGENGTANRQAKEIAGSLKYLKEAQDEQLLREGGSKGVKTGNLTINVDPADNGKVLFVTGDGFNVNLNGSVVGQFLDGSKVVVVCLSGSGFIAGLSGASVYVEGKLNGVSYEIEPGDQVTIWVHNGSYYVFNPASKNHHVPTGAMVKSGIVSELILQYIWKSCDGSNVSRTDPQFAKLFSVIGTSYGIGDGSTTFKIPDEPGFMIKL